MPEQRMVTVAVLAPFPARLLAARLGAEGILWQLRGGSSVYPFAPVEVLVAVDEVDQARDVLALEPLEVVDEVVDERADEVAEGAIERASGEAVGVGAAASPVTRSPAGAEREPAVDRPSGRSRQLWLWLGVAAIVVALALQVAHV